MYTAEKMGRSAYHSRQKRKVIWSEALGWWSASEGAGEDMLSTLYVLENRSLGFVGLGALSFLTTLRNSIGG